MNSFLQQQLAAIDYQPQRLMTVLTAIQSHYHHIPEAAVDTLSQQLHLTPADIHAVIEFYSFYHRNPQGQYAILISDSITDHLLGSQAILRELAQQLQVEVGQVRGDGRVSLNVTSCTGLCDQGPAGLINGYPLTHLTRNSIAEIAALIAQGLPVSEWPQQLFAVHDNLIQPGLLLQQPITSGAAIQAAYQRGLPATLDEIAQSGLRGRGGAGFKTAMKWRFCAETASHQRYVVCNADEGEPGTFKDRVLLNRYADQVFEGMTVCAAIIGASQGFLYLRGEYQFLLEPLQHCLQQRRQQGLLGNNIAQHGFDFDIEIRLGAGAYICGEESALIESLEGKPGIPRNRPPYPVTSGYLNQPTVVNNVETFLAAAAIAVHGGAWFAAHGTAQSAGSKILSICGDCRQPGIYEYPFGTPIRQILHDCGADDVLGVQIGGPSGCFISASECDRTLAFEDLATGGSFIVFNNSRDVLAIAENFTHFFAHESCGFCTPCRVGTSLLNNQLHKITSGHGSAGDVAELESLCQVVKNYSHCGLGQTAANPILSTLERFPEQYHSRLKAISYEPGFDLDAALATARRMANRNDAAAHLTQVED